MGNRTLVAKRLPFAENRPAQIMFHSVDFPTIFSPIHMKSVNKVILLGNVTRDAELNSTIGERHVCQFGLATNRVWKDSNGEKQSLPEYHNVVCWGGLAEFAGQHVKKGKPLYLEGHLKTHVWETPEGIKKERTEIVLDNIVLLGARDLAAAPPAEEAEEFEVDRHVASV